MSSQTPAFLSDSFIHTKCIALQCLVPATAVPWVWSDIWWCLWCGSDNICSWARADVAVKNRNIFPGPGGSAVSFVLFLLLLCLWRGWKIKLSTTVGKITNKEGRRIHFLDCWWGRQCLLSQRSCVQRCRPEKWSVVSDQGTNYHAPIDHLNLIKK